MTDPYLNLSGRRRRAMLDAVLARDGWLCCICGLPITPGTESLQHKTPRSKGGAPLDPANLAPAHRTCNSAAGDRIVKGPAGEIHDGLLYFTRPITAQ